MVCLPSRHPTILCSNRTLRNGLLNIFVLSISCQLFCQNIILRVFLLTLLFLKPEAICGKVWQLSNVCKSRKSIQKYVISCGRHAQTDVFFGTIVFLFFWIFLQGKEHSEASCATFNVSPHYIKGSCNNYSLVWDLGGHNLCDECKQLLIQSDERTSWLHLLSNGLWQRCNQTALPQDSTIGIKERSTVINGYYKSLWFEISSIPNGRPQL